MGLFYDTQPVDQVLQQHLVRAYASPTLTDADATAAAGETLAAVKRDVAAAHRFKPWRVVVAFGVFGALAGGGIAADAVGLQDSRAALFGFAGSVFGVIVGFLGSEKSAT